MQSKHWFVGLVTALLVSACSAPTGTIRSGAPTLPDGSSASALDAAMAQNLEKALAERTKDVGVIPPLEGWVDFGQERGVLASVGDVVNFATVTFYDPELARSVASTVTNSNGGFSLSLGNWIPDSDIPYIVEATKGLGNYVPGWAMPRFRTIVRYNSVSKAWESISTPNVVIGAQTTAVAIEVGLYPDKVKPELVMGSVDVSARPATFLPKDVFMAGKATYSGHNIAELVKLSAELLTLLQNDLDPVISVPEVVPTIIGVTPDNGVAGNLVTIDGRGFSPMASGNKVTFNGVTAKIVLSKTTQLIVEVPSGATSGNLVVEGRAIAAPKTFTINQSGPTFAINFAFPSSGTPGTSVTILGFGFSKTAADNTVFFDNVSTPCATSDTSFCSVAVPAAAQKGPLSVDVKNVGKSNTLAFSVLIQPVVDSMYPNTGTPNSQVTLSGSNFGAVAGKVAIQGVDAPVVSWADKQIVATVPTGTVPGPLTVTKGSLPALSVGDFGVLTGKFTSWGTFNDQGSSYSHQGGWLGRWGKWWYMGGGYASCCAQWTGYNKGPVQRAEINPDGTLGNLTVLAGLETPGNMFWQQEAGYDLAHSPNVIGDYAYLYPGYDPWSNNNAENKTVYRAKFFADGSMSPFAAYTTLARGPGWWGDIIRIKDYVHIIAGCCVGGGGLVQSAKINSDGSLNAFQSGSSHPFEYNAGAVHVGKWLYTFGGPARSETFRIAVNPDGSLSGNWANVGSMNLPWTIAHGNSMQIGSTVYVIEGHNWSTCNWGCGRILRQNIGANDELGGGWEHFTNQPRGKHDAGVLVVGKRLYINGTYDGNHRPNIDYNDLQ
jgi:hypothetical protein